MRFNNPKALARYRDRLVREMEEMKAELARRRLVSFPDLPLELSEHIASGYANRFGNVDSHGDVVRPGAFDDWLKWYRRQDEPLLLLAEHQTQPDAVLGVARDVSVNDEGLLTTFVLLEDVAEYVIGEVRAARWDGLSIGYRPVLYEDPTWEERERGARRALTKVFVREVSLVKRPANTGARVLETKSLTDLVIGNVRKLLVTACNPTLSVTEHGALVHRIRKLTGSHYSV